MGINGRGPEKFHRGMLSSAADELVHIIMNMDAMQFKTMFEQTRSMVIDQEEDLKKKTDLIMQLESKVSLHILSNKIRRTISFIVFAAFGAGYRAAECNRGA